MPTPSRSGRLPRPLHCSSGLSRPTRGLAVSALRLALADSKKVGDGAGRREGGGQGLTHLEASSNVAEDTISSYSGPRLASCGAPSRHNHKMPSQTYDVTQTGRSVSDTLRAKGKADATQRAGSAHTRLQRARTTQRRTSTQAPSTRASNAAIAVNTWPPAAAAGSGGPPGAPGGGCWGCVRGKETAA